MLCVCVGDVMDVVFSVCIVRRGAVGARVWGVFRHADVISTVKYQKRLTPNFFKSFFYRNQYLIPRYTMC